MLAQRLPGLLPGSVAGRGAGSHHDPQPGRQSRRRTVAAAAPSAIRILGEPAGAGGRVAEGAARARSASPISASLFLDDLPEFQRSTLEALRQPMETGRVSIARANAHVTYLARVAGAAAMNPCRCGHLGDSGAGRQRCQMRSITNRHLCVARPYSIWHAEAPPASRPTSRRRPREGSADVAARVAAARARQMARYAAHNLRRNAEADGELLEKLATPDAEGRRLLTQAVEKFRLPRAAITACCASPAPSPIFEAAADVRVIHIAEAPWPRRLLARAVSLLFAAFSAISGRKRSRATTARSAVPSPIRLDLILRPRGEAHAASVDFRAGNVNGDLHAGRGRGEMEDADGDTETRPLPASRCGFTRVDA